MNFTNSISYPGQKTAAAIIIGNEILSGKFQDTNTFFLAKTLYQRGVKLKRVETIMDDMEEIGEAVRRLSAQVDYVFTSGGIGPTLDDITYEAIAKAFNLKLVLNDRVVEEMKRVSPQHELNPARLRMATLPETSELLFSEGLWVPIAVVNSNVHILPGVPWIFERMMNSNKSRFGTGVPLVSKIVYTNLLEGELSASLDTVAGEFPQLVFGSYPRTSNEQRYNVMLTLEGVDANQVDDAANKLKELVQGQFDISQLGFRD